MVQFDPESFSKWEVRASVAAGRLGFGARPDELPFIAENPTGWLRAQLVDVTTPPELARQPDSRRRTLQLIHMHGETAATRAAFRRQASLAFREEAARHALVAINGEKPFRERLVRFWCNHFAVSARNPDWGDLAYAFERDVVRPNLNARFYDMLLAAIRHPALLLPLQGAAAFAGERRPVPGDIRDTAIDVTAESDPLAIPNRNLAKAVLEDYTIGPADLYGNRDILALARMFSGWGVGAPGEDGAGGFVFRPERHVDGNKLFLGQVYPQAGLLEGEAALETLSRMPETARFLAAKMARHFLADDGREADFLADEVYGGYANGAGSLLAMSDAMLESAAIWTPPPMKLKLPDELVISCLRALDLRPATGGDAVEAMTMLGQMPKAMPAFTGWPDLARDWLNGDSLPDRLAWLHGAAHSKPAGIPATELAVQVLGARLTPATFRRMAAAGEGVESLALFFASPEFQRR